MITLISSQRQVHAGAFVYAATEPNEGKRVLTIFSASWGQSATDHSAPAPGTPPAAGGRGVGKGAVSQPWGTRYPPSS